MNSFTFVFVGLFSIFPSVFSQDELVMVQILHRHGSRTPEDIDPFDAELWAPFGLAPGQLTTRGADELLSLGRILHESYITNAELLPEVYDQNLVYARASSQSFARAFMSTEAFVRGFYPGATVPIYTVNPAEETLMGWMNRCPSYESERPRITKEFDQIFLSEFPEIIGNLTERTGWDSSGIPLSSAMLIVETTDNHLCKETHGFPLDPYVVANWENIFGMFLRVWRAWYADLQDEGYGGFSGDWARLIANNVVDLMEGSPVRLYINGGHGFPLTGLMKSIGVSDQVWNLGDALTLEVRRRLSDGELFIQGFYWSFEGSSLEYTSTQITLSCPAANQIICDAQSFIDFINNRNPLPSPSQECCFVGPGFYDHGCDDYLNAAVLDIYECSLYRKYCPAVSCGTGQVLDRATRLCFQVAKSIV